MKTACLLCVVFGGAVLAHGPSRIASPGQASQQRPAASAANDRSRDSGHAPATGKGGGRADGKFSDGQRARSLISGGGSHGGPVSLGKPRRPEVMRNHPERPPSGGNAVVQPDSDRVGRAAEGGLIQNKTAGKFMPVRSVGVRTTAPLLNNVRRRSLNPAAIGGPAKSKPENTAAINGTEMHRKP